MLGCSLTLVDVAELLIEFDVRSTLYVSLMSRVK